MAGGHAGSRIRRLNWPWTAHPLHAPEPGKCFGSDEARAGPALALGVCAGHVLTVQGPVRKRARAAGSYSRIRVSCCGSGTPGSSQPQGLTRGMSCPPLAVTISIIATTGVFHAGRCVLGSDFPADGVRSRANATVRGLLQGFVVLVGEQHRSTRTQQSSDGPAQAPGSAGLLQHPSAPSNEG